MQLHELDSLLKNNPEKPFRIILPGGDLVPVSFHVTEVGHVKKTFLDCGGKLHETETCQLQVWLGEDEDHRIASGKLAGILGKAKGFFPNDGIPVEIEYEAGVISQYTISGHAVEESAVILNLANKHTACLAPELCGVSPEKNDADSEGCCSGSGCCS